MSAFKDVVEGDIRRVFLNEDEFAEKHDIDGEKIVVMLDIDRMNERRDKAGLSDENLYFYVKEKELGRRPKVNSPMLFDGLHHIVTECIENDGVLEIALARQNVGVL